MTYFKYFSNLDGLFHSRIHDLSLHRLPTSNEPLDMSEALVDRRRIERCLIERHDARVSYRQQSPEYTLYIQK